MPHMPTPQATATAFAERHAAWQHADAMACAAERALSRAGFLSAAGGLTALTFTNPLLALIPVFTAVAFGTGVLRPALTSLVTRAVGRKEQGVVLGLTQSLNSTASIVSPVIAGFLIGHGQLAAWALLGAVLSTAGLLIVAPAAETVPA